MKKTKDIIKEITRLNADFLSLLFGNVCQLCDTIFFEDGALMTIHILGKKAHPVLRFETFNQLLGCNDCHRKYDDPKTKDEVIKKIKKIKGNDYLNTLYSMERSKGLQKLNYDAIKNSFKNRIKELSK